MEIVPDIHSPTVYDFIISWQG